MERSATLEFALLFVIHAASSTFMKKATGRVGDDVKFWRWCRVPTTCSCTDPRIGHADDVVVGHRSRRVIAKTRTLRLALARRKDIPPIKVRQIDNTDRSPIE